MEDNFYVATMTKDEFDEFREDPPYLPFMIFVYGYSEQRINVYVPPMFVEQMSAIQWCNKTLKVSEIRGYGSEWGCRASAVVPVLRTRSDMMSVLMSRAIELARKAYITN